MYTQEITRTHRTAFVIAIDQSSSMQESVVVNSRRMTKAEAVAAITNRLIDELVMRARRDDGDTLLVNVHISTNPAQRSIIFPRIDELGSDDKCARLLAEISSRVPDAMNDSVRRFRGDFALPPFVAMSYNASITEALAMMDIGSRSATVLR